MCYRKQTVLIEETLYSYTISLILLALGFMGLHIDAANLAFPSSKRCSLTVD